MRYPYFDIFTHYVCLFCSDIVFNIRNLYATIKPGLPFSKLENILLSQEYDTCNLMIKFATIDKLKFAIRV